MCIYCPLVILITDQFLNEHLTHISIKLLHVAGRGLSQLLSGISVFVTQFLAAPTPHPCALRRSSPVNLSSIGRMDTLVRALALLSCLGSNHGSFTSYLCGFLPTCLTFLMHRMGTMTMAILEGLVCVYGGGVGRRVWELNETVHQNSQCSKRIHSLWKIGRQVFKKFRTELLYDLGIPLPSIYLKEMKAKIPTDMCT